MLRKARQMDPDNDYLLVAPGDLRTLAPGYDLILSAFTFDNIPAENKPSLLKQLAGLLKPQGVLVSVVSSPEIYWHEWASFSTRDYAVDNRNARSGDPVLIVTTDFEDRRPCVDVLCTDEAYNRLYADAGLLVVEKAPADRHRPRAVSLDQRNHRCPVGHLGAATGANGRETAEN